MYIYIVSVYVNEAKKYWTYQVNYELLVISTGLFQPSSNWMLQKDTPEPNDTQDLEHEQQWQAAIDDKLWAAFSALDGVERLVNVENGPYFKIDFENKPSITVKESDSLLKP